MYEKLMHIGLTKTEAKIYVVLVDIGRGQAGVISRKTGIHRRSIYDALERLIKKGLVSYIRENDVRLYIPTDPKRIQELIDEQKEEVYQLLPTLQAKFEEKQSGQHTHFYRGKQGIKTIFEDQLREGKNVYVIGASREAKELLKFYIRHYTTKRIKAKVKLHALYSGEKHVRTVPFSEIRYLPKSFASPVSTNIYGNKVAIIVWSHEPVAILIHEKEISETYMKYFKMLWKTARR